MLILMRRPGETVMIGDDIVITVLGVARNRVRIGIKAPKDVPVHREEIYERIKHEAQSGHGGHENDGPDAEAEEEEAGQEEAPRYRRRA